MTKAIDITDRKFGRLTAIKKGEIRYGKKTYWFFRCDCGIEKEIEKQSVLRGMAKSCGCLFDSIKSTESNTANLKFGSLTPIKAVDSSRDSYSVYWLFRCDCGNEKEINVSSVKTGRTRTCGCLARVVSEKRRIDISGQKFGMLTAIKYVRKANGSLIWLFRCDCGNEKEILKRSVIAGASKSCGCRKNRGGRWENEGGYIFVYKTVNGKKQSIGEHRFIMEKFLGRELFKGETVHHKNGIRNDNRIENLELWSENHPSGQRVEDKINFALEILNRYAPELLKNQIKTASA